MRNNKPVIFSVITTLLVAGVTSARAETKPSPEQSVSASTSTRAHPSAYAAQIAQTGNDTKSCTYRGGPKTGTWDCRR